MDFLVHLSAVAVRVGALERRQAQVVVLPDDLDPVRARPAKRGADISGEPEPDVQERLRRAGIARRVQGEVKPSALRMMIVPSPYRCTVAGSKPRYVA